MKAGNVFVRIAQLQLVKNVVPHPLGGAGGEGRNGTVGKMRAQTAQLPVFRAKLMPPLRDAMGFVNREKRDRYTLQPIKSIGSRQTFRRKIQQAELAFAMPFA